MTSYDKVREICLSLPDTEEKLAWGEPTFRVGGRLFLMFANNHHNDGRIAVWLAAPDGVQRDVVAADPDNLFLPPYVGKGGWIGVRLDRKLPLRAVRAFIEQAHATIAAKKKRRPAGRR